ncbi:MAG TPA: MmcQ/YjbR family DNA-binding protein [Thermomonospora sp.]|nr:MmcQ/YjbR family DNA-binding protein [Thermomonospora sp.]
MSTSVDERRARVVAICSGLPEVVGEAGRHVTFRVRRRTFAYYLDDHHGDGRLSFQCKAAPGEQEALVAADPARFFVPPYLGPRGWVGVYLDVPGVNWDEIAELAVESYRLVAPRRLVALL